MGVFHYHRWRDLTMLPDGATELWTESDEDGVVRREIGLNASGAIVHQFPSRIADYGTRGHFDQTPIAPSASDSLDSSIFEATWERASVLMASGGRAAEHLALVRRAKRRFRLWLAGE